jgi:hypothetical protein
LSYILINGGIPVVIKHIADPNPPISYEELAKAFGDILESYGGNQKVGSSKNNS